MMCQNGLVWIHCSGSSYNEDEGSLVGFRLRRRSLCESHLVIDNVSISYLMNF